MTDFHKCAIVGCGFVGSSIAFSLLESGLFREMILIDINREKAQGEAMDLGHSIPFIKPMEIAAGEWQDLKGAGIVIIAAGASQKPGESRADLAHKNLQIFREMIPKITQYNQDGILLIVSNPVDILTYAALQYSGFSKERVFGSGTVLDTARLKYLLGKKLSLDPRVVHAFIIGEHGDSELPVWSSANISGIDLKDYCAATGETLKDSDFENLYREVRDSAYQIIQKKGATYYGIASSCRRICESIVRDEHSILPVSTFIDGHYGLSDICMGVPAILSSKGVERVLDIPLNEEEQKLLIQSASAVQKILREDCC